MVIKAIILVFFALLAYGVAFIALAWMLGIDVTWGAIVLVLGMGAIGNMPIRLSPNGTRSG